MRLTLLTLDELQRIFLPSKIAERYQKDYPENKLKANEAFREMLKYLWVCIKHKQETASPEFQIMIYSEMKEIDDMWHTYILFTRDYAELCDKVFGQFVHHTPTTSAEKEKFKKNKSEFMHQKKQALSYVYDNLGEETLITWFNQYFNRKVQK